MMENNIEKSFPFDAQDVDGNYDRVYTADDFARYFRSFISSGLFMEKNTSLQVLANDDMTVTLRPGKMMIDGYRYDAEGDIIIPISPADGLLDRIDRISITWSRADRDIHCTIQEGEFSYGPTAPVCRRSAEYKDYVVADIYVAANSISITQSAITDQRLNSEVCGLAVPFMSIDTTLIFNQLQAFYEETVRNNAIWTDSERGKFEQWMELIKNQLSDDAAGHLQLQIDVIREQIDNLQECDKSSKNMMTDEFSAEKSYIQGDFCIYENVLYKFTSDKEAGPWDPEAVEATTVLGEIGALRDIVMELVDRMGGLSFRAMSQEDYNNLPEKVENRIYFAVDNSATTLVDTPIQILPVPDNVGAGSQEDNEATTIPIDTPIQLLPAPGDVAVAMSSKDDLENVEDKVMPPFEDNLESEENEGEVMLHDSAEK